MLMTYFKSASAFTMAAVFGGAMFLSVAGASEASARASFTCDSHSNATERKICRNWYLGRLDRKMDRMYRDVSDQLSRRASYRLRRVQQLWLDKRDECDGRFWCIGRKYRARIKQLRELESCLDDSVEPGCIYRTIWRHSWALNGGRQFDRGRRARLRWRGFASD